MGLRISAYKTDDGMVFNGDNAQKESKQHDYWLRLVTLAATMPLQASSETAGQVVKQRAGWLQENAKEIAKLTKHAMNHARPNGHARSDNGNE